MLKQLRDFANTDRVHRWDRDKLLAIAEGLEALSSENRPSHGGRPMTLRECAEAEEPSTDKRDDTPRTELLLETMELEKKDIWQALKIVTDWARDLERELEEYERELDALKSANTALLDLLRRALPHVDFMQEYIFGSRAENARAVCRDIEQALETSHQYVSQSIPK